MSEPLTEALIENIAEQVERTTHLIGLVSVDRMEWAPPIPRSWTTRELLWHLADCHKGFCAVLYAIEPERLAHLQNYRSEQPPSGGTPDEIAADIGKLKKEILSGFELVNDAVLARRIPTLFVPAGEPVLTLFLRNLEHLINHKHQLFTYLRQMGSNVASHDLYCFR